MIIMENCLVNSLGECIFFIDDIINFGKTYYDNEKNVIAGIPVLTANKVLKIKEKLGREKDKTDLMYKKDTVH